MIGLSPLKAQLDGKAVAVMGLGRSGMPVFEACRAAGIETVLWDDDAMARDAAAAKGARLEDLNGADFSRFAFLCLAPGIPLTHPRPNPVALRARDAGVPVVCDIELFHRAKPRARTIGITGTNGKSTTTALAAHILKSAGVAAAAGGNIGEAILTLPDLGDDGVYVIEMSSYQLDLCATFAPRIAALINLAPDHLDRHGGMKGYVAAKERIFRGPGVAVIGVDDAESRALCARVRRAGAREVAEVAAPADGILHGIDLKECPNLKGAHNWQNAAIAYAACRAAGVGAEEIARGMRSFPGLAHRQNVVAVIGGVAYVNDSKATNDQAAAVALRTYDPVYWIAGGRPKAGGYGDCEKYLLHVRRAFLIGEAEGEMAAWLESKGVAHDRCGTLDRAVAAAHAAAREEGLPGAVVLLSPACASWDQFKSFEHRGDEFVKLVRGLA